MPQTEHSITYAAPQPVSWMYALPLFAVLLGAIEAQKPLDINGLTSIDPASGLVYQVLSATTYFMALVLMLRRLPEFLTLLRNNIAYVLLLGYALASTFWSEFPLKVIITWGHYVGTALICMASVLAFEKHPQELFRMLVIFGLGITLGSVVLVFAAPSLGISGSDHIRWNGVTGNPNTLGLVSMVSVWAAASYYQYAPSLRGKLLSLTLLAIAALCLYGSNSVTSILISAMIVMAVFIIIDLQRSSLDIQMFKLAAWAAAATVATFSIFVLAPHVFSEKWVFDNVGRSGTFTGRETLWELARRAINEKPLLGWSFDALTSFAMQYKLGFGQLHNGYFDLAVRGGLIGVMFIVYFAVKSMIMCGSLARHDPRLAVLLGTVVIAVLLHNVTETSLVRSPHTLWTLFTFAYFYLNQSLRNLRSADHDSS